jgi:hypothetical protein
MTWKALPSRSYYWLEGRHVFSHVRPTSFEFVEAHPGDLTSSA